MPALFEKLELEGSSLELFLLKIEMIKKTLNEIAQEKAQKEGK